MGPSAQHADDVAVAGSVRNRDRWWRHRAVRIVAGVLTGLALIVPWLLIPQDEHWQWQLTDSLSLDVSPRRLEVYAALLLMPFMRKVSYRKRDVLIIVLVPFYGEYVAGKIVSRLLYLPRRDWLPRFDELPRVVRIPHARGDYLLLRSFTEAEQLRTQWCVNPEHDHPYANWSTAEQLGCVRKTATG